MAASELLEQLRELNSARMREMLARIDAADLPTIDHAIQLLDAAVAAEAADPVPHHQKGTRS